MLHTLHSYSLQRYQHGAVEILPCLAAVRPCSYRYNIDSSHLLLPVCRLQTPSWSPECLSDVYTVTIMAEWKHCCNHGDGLIQKAYHTRDLTKFWSSVCVCVSVRACVRGWKKKRAFWQWHDLQSVFMKASNNPQCSALLENSYELPAVNQSMVFLALFMSH